MAKYSLSSLRKLKQSLSTLGMTSQMGWRAKHNGYQRAIPGCACGTKGLGRFRKTPASCGLARSKALKRFDPTLYTISRWGLPPRTCTSASSMPLVDVRRLSPPPLLLLLLLPRSFYLSVLPIVTRHPNKSSIYRQNFYSLDLVIKIHLRDLTLIVSSRPGYHST